MHGHERSTKARRNYNHKLYARLHAVERKNTRRVFESIESQMIFQRVHYVTF